MTIFKHLLILCAAPILGLALSKSEAATLTVDPPTVAAAGEKTLVHWHADAAGCTIDFKTAAGDSGSWGVVPADDGGGENAWIQSSTTFIMICNGSPVVSAGVVVAGVPAPSVVPEAPTPAPEPVPDDLPRYAVLCGVDSEIRTLWRKMPVPPNRFYFGCRDPETLMTYTWFMDTTKADEVSIWSWGSYALRTSTWPYPRGITIAEPWEAVSLCDRWYLWADNDKAAPKMTRAAKLKQAGC